MAPTSPTTGTAGWMKTTLPLQPALLDVSVGGSDTSVGDRHVRPGPGPGPGPAALCEGGAANRLVKGGARAFSGSCAHSPALTIRSKPLYPPGTLCPQQAGGEPKDSEAP